MSYPLNDESSTSPRLRGAGKSASIIAEGRAILNIFNPRLKSEKFLKYFYQTGLEMFLGNVMP